MSKKTDNFDPNGLTISYKQLGVISVKEFEQAVLTDILALRDIFGVEYLKAPRLIVHATNEYGDPLRIRRPHGRRVYFLDTHHFRPACKDYEL